MGDRVERYRGQSTMTGMYVVEDVCVGEDHVRRLIHWWWGWVVAG